MSFDSNQPSYHALRKIFAERTKGVVIFTGAGLSRSAGIHSWHELRNKLVEAAEKHLSPRKPEETKVERSLLSLAIEERDLWLAFQHLKRVLGETTYHAEMRALFPDVPPPAIYESLWSLTGVDGCVTLNIDRLASRAFAEVYGGRRSLTDFCGIDFHRHQDVLNSGNRFLVNLHGVITDVASWVFTAEERDSLYRDQAYLTFIRVLFSSKTVVFIGVTADMRQWLHT
jgi:eukaryotic-like serine/threonine-protein kinase